MSLEGAMRQNDEASTAGYGSGRSGAVDRARNSRSCRDLNLPNRRMRTRMSGGVAGGNPLCRLGTYANQNFGLESFQNPKNISNKRLKRFDAVAFGHKNHDRHRQSSAVLLEFDVLVSGQQRVKLCGSLPIIYLQSTSI